MKLNLIIILFLIVFLSCNDKNTDVNIITYKWQDINCIIRKNLDDLPRLNDENRNFKLFTDIIIEVTNNSPDTLFYPFNIALPILKIKDNIYKYNFSNRKNSSFFIPPKEITMLSFIPTKPIIEFKEKVGGVEFDFLVNTVCDSIIANSEFEFLELNTKKNVKLRMNFKIIHVAPSGASVSLAAKAVTTKGKIGNKTNRHKK